MKSSLILLFIFFTFSGVAQNIVAKKQAWAGGICCRSGVNYYLTLEYKSEDDIPKALSIDSVTIDGWVFESSMIKIMRVQNFIQLHFGYTQDDYQYENVKHFPQKTEAKNQLFISSQNKNHILEIENIEELMYLAYP